MRVLVVDDDLSVGRGMLRLLKLLGHEGDLVQDAASALHALGTAQVYGAALVDLGLQNGDSGMDVIAWIRSNRPAVRCVLTSGTHRPAGFQPDPPLQQFLPKPVALIVLAAALR